MILDPFLIAFFHQSKIFRGDGKEKEAEKLFLKMSKTRFVKRFRSKILSNHALDKVFAPVDSFELF